MLDVDTFLTALYVIVDDFCHSQPPKKRPGPKASLSDSEVVTLATFARWGRLCGERDFYRYARKHLHDAFPTLPDRSQFNRLVRSCVSHRGGCTAPGTYAKCPSKCPRRRLLRGFGHLGHARSRREAQRRGMACWLRGDRVVQ